jgi:hypothetical protein
MRPSRPAPSGFPHEVRVPVGDPQVVDPLVFAGVEEVFDALPIAAFRQDPVVDGKFEGVLPLPFTRLGIIAEKRVFGSRPDDLPTVV